MTSKYHGQKGYVDKMLEVKIEKAIKLLQKFDVV